MDGTSRHVVQTERDVANRTGRASALGDSLQWTVPRGGHGKHELQIAKSDGADRPVFDWSDSGANMGREISLADVDRLSSSAVRHLQEKISHRADRVGRKRRQWAWPYRRIICPEQCC